MYEFNTNGESIGCVNPSQRANHGAFKSPFIHFLIGCVTSVEKAEIEPRSVRLFTVFG